MFYFKHLCYANVHSTKSESPGLTSTPKPLLPWGGGAAVNSARGNTYASGPFRCTHAQTDGCASARAGPGPRVVPPRPLRSQHCLVDVRGELAPGFRALQQLSHPTGLPALRWVRPPLWCQTWSQGTDSQSCSPSLSSLRLAQFTPGKV